MEAITVKQLTVQWNDKELLKDISFELSLGETLVIIGESGSGKTLLTKLLLGQQVDTLTVTGNLHYKELNLRKLSYKTWQKIRGAEIAYMVQNPMAMFNPCQTIQTHFLETLQSHNKWTKATCLKKARASMSTLRLGHPEYLLTKYPFELSGGMLQRIMLAILLCLDPKVIILDEPTSALDAKNCDNMLQIIKSLQKQGKTIITVTHDYQLAHELGGNVLVMLKGKVIESGKVEEVFASPKHHYTEELLSQNHYERLVTKDD